MIAVFLDGPIAGRIEEFPHDVDTIRVPVMGYPARVIEYLKLGFDVNGRRMFAVTGQPSVRELRSRGFLN